MHACMYCEEKKKQPLKVTPHEKQDNGTERLYVVIRGGTREAPPENLHVQHTYQSVFFVFFSFAWLLEDTSEHPYLVHQIYLFRHQYKTRDRMDATLKAW